MRENQLPIYETEILSRNNQIEEEMFLGLRKKSGISKFHFKQKFGVDMEVIYGDVMRDLVKKDWLVVSDKHIALTKKGLLIGNEIFEKFLLD